MASRREAENLIRDGMVKVNSKTVTELGIKADPIEDKIEVKGDSITNLETNVYIMLNKPKGFITALKDPQRRPIVTDLLTDIKQRVFPIGRLDYDTEGLLLFTNDGDLAHCLLHPSRRIYKTYLGEIDGMLSPGKIKRFKSGVELSDGVTAPAKLELIKRRKNRSLWKISIYEGRKRQIKRMFEGIGHTVCELKRIGFGPLELGQLATGKYRFLTDRELKDLKRNLKLIRIKT